MFFSCTPADNVGLCYLVVSEEWEHGRGRLQEHERQHCVCAMMSLSPLRVRGKQKWLLCFVQVKDLKFFIQNVTRTI